MENIPTDKRPAQIPGTQLTTGQFNRLPRFHLPTLISYIIVFPSALRRDPSNKEKQKNIFDNFEDEEDFALMCCGIDQNNVSLTKDSELKDKAKVIADIAIALNAGAFFGFLGNNPLDVVEIRDPELYEDKTIRSLRVITVNHEILGSDPINIAIVESE